MSSERPRLMDDAMKSAAGRARAKSSESSLSYRDGK